MTKVGQRSTIVMGAKELVQQHAAATVLVLGIIAFLAAGVTSRGFRHALTLKNPGIDGFLDSTLAKALTAGLGIGGISLLGGAFTAHYLGKQTPEIVKGLIQDLRKKLQESKDKESDLARQFWKASDEGLEEEAVAALNGRKAPLANNAKENVNERKLERKWRAQERISWKLQKKLTELEAFVQKKLTAIQAKSQSLEGRDLSPAGTEPRPPMEGFGPADVESEELTEDRAEKKNSKKPAPTRNELLAYEHRDLTKLEAMYSQYERRFNELQEQMKANVALAVDEEYNLLQDMATLKQKIEEIKINSLLTPAELRDRNKAKLISRLTSLRLDYTSIENELGTLAKQPDTPQARARKAQLLENQKRIQEKIDQIQIEAEREKAQPQQMQAEGQKGAQLVEPNVRTISEEQWVEASNRTTNEMALLTRIRKLEEDRRKNKANFAKTLPEVDPELVQRDSELLAEIKVLKAQLREGRQAGSQKGADAPKAEPLAVTMSAADLKANAKKTEARKNADKAWDDFHAACMNEPEGPSKKKDALSKKAHKLEAKYDALPGISFYLTPQELDALNESRRSDGKSTFSMSDVAGRAKSETQRQLFVTWQAVYPVFMARDALKATGKKEDSPELDDFDKSNEEVMEAFNEAEKAFDKATGQSKPS